MIVTFSQDSMGNIHAAPVSAAHQARFAEHCAQFHPGHDGSAFIQEAQPEDLAGILPPRRINELFEGYNVRVRMSAWDYGHLLGYDAHYVEV